MSALRHALGRAIPAVAFLLLVVLAVPAGAEVRSAPNIAWAIGSQDSLYYPGSAPDAAQELAVLPCSFDFGTSTLPPGVTRVQLAFTYKSDELTYVGWEPNTDFWPADETLVTFETVGPDSVRVTIKLDDHTAWLTEPAQVFGWVQFRTLCREPGAMSQLTIDPDEMRSFIIDNSGGGYHAPAESCTHGVVTLFGYNGYVSLADDDPFTGDPAVITLQGAVGNATRFDVPIYLETGANVHIIQAFVQFDTLRVAYVEGEAVDACNAWAGPAYSFTEIEPGLVYLQLFNTAGVRDDDAGPCQIGWLRFEVIGEWEGQSTDIAFYTVPPWENHVNVLTDPPSTCDLLDWNYTWHDVTVTIEDYAITLDPVVDSLIYAESLNEDKEFTLTFQAAHNFSIGGGAEVDPNDPVAMSNPGNDNLAPIRFFLGLDADMNVRGFTQLDDFHFTGTLSGLKTAAKQFEVFNIPVLGKPNQRALAADPADLVKIRMEIMDVQRPATFADHVRTITYLPTFDGLGPRVLDAPASSVEVVPPQLAFSAQPVIKYAVAELSCATRTATRPTDVVQQYWMRSSFDVADFQVTVRKSGYHHIVSIEPAEGVDVAANGSDFVTFVPDTDGAWTPGTFTTPRLLATIRYNTLYRPVDIEEEAEENFDKESGPGITWCWKWSTISFDPGSYLTDTTGKLPFMYFVTGNVGTRWDCSPVVIPEPFPEPRGSALDLPTVFALHDNVPNPFNPITTLYFDLPQAEHVSITVLDIRGRRVRTLLSEPRDAGRHDVAWDGTDDTGRRVPSGVYFAAMQAGEFRQMTKMVLMK